MPQKKSSRKGFVAHSKFLEMKQFQEIDATHKDIVHQKTNLKKCKVAHPEP